MKLSIFVVILLVSQVASTSVGNTAFVDSIFGNDATGVVQNTDLSFKTIGAAILAVAAHGPSPADVWEVIIQAGTYIEHVSVSDSIYLTGTGPNTVIVGAVFHSGGTLLTNILISSTNEPAVVNNATEDVNYLSCVISTTYTSTFVSSAPITTVQVNAGEFGMTSGAIFSTYKSAATQAYMIHAPGGGFVLQQTELVLTVKGSITNLSYYSASNVAKASILTGVTTATMTAPGTVANLIVFDYASITIATSVGNRITINGNPAAPAIKYQIAKVSGVTNLEINGGIVATTQVGTSQFVFAEGIVVAGVAPTFGSTSLAFSTIVVPNNIGTFSTIHLANPDTFGSLKLNGGLYTNIVQVSADYTVLLSDYTVIVSAHATVTLPNYPTSKGRIVIVSNESSDEVHVAGTIFGHPSGRVHVGRGAAKTFQNDGTNWFVLNF